MHSKRPAFTLVEMMVSVALIIFIMVILTEAFVTGMDSMQQLKVQGELQEQLRVATSILRRDLAADHFEGKKRLSDPNFWADGPPREGYLRVWQGVRLATTRLAPVPPTGTPALPYLYEGVDGDGNPSFRATDHMLQFTVKRRGNLPGEFASVGISDPALLQTVPNPGARFQAAGTYATQWYEVAYFLRATGETTAGNIPLYALYRRQRAVVPNPSVLNYGKPNPANPSVVDYSTLVPASLITNYSEVSAQLNLHPPNQKNPPSLFFNNPNNLTVPQHRFGMMVSPANTLGAGADVGGWPSVRPNPNDPTTWTLPIMADLNQNPALAGSDLLLSNVVSFQVQLLMTPTGDFEDIRVGSQPPNFYSISAVNNPSFQRTVAGKTYSAFVFDTWSSRRDDWCLGANDNYDFSQWSQNGTAQAAPWWKLGADPQAPRVRIFAIKITLRIWDLKAQKTRQITVIQDM